MHDHRSAVWADLGKATPVPHAHSHIGLVQNEVVKQEGKSGFVARAHVHPNYMWALQIVPQVARHAL